MISCDEGNEILRNYFMVNFVIEGYKGISTDFVGYRLKLREK